MSISNAEQKCNTPFTSQDMPIQLLDAIIMENLSRVALHPTQLRIEHLEVNDELDISDIISSMEEEITDNEYQILKDRIEGTLHNLDWDTIILPCKTCTVYTNYTGNTDTRGGGCGRYSRFFGWTKEDFMVKIEGKNGITLGQLMDAVYLVKGSKYDLWYELFHGINITKKNMDEWEILVKYGYGS